MTLESKQFENAHGVNELASIDGNYYTIHENQDFLDPNFTLLLTPQSQDLFSKGCPGQGYVGLVDLETGFIHLLPAFNQADGLIRKDKDGKEFASNKFVESRGKLGALGDLHGQACFKLSLLDKSGSRKKVLGFGIWKNGVGIKFLDTQPERSGLVPNEYLFIKTHNGHKLLYVNQNREITALDYTAILGPVFVSWLGQASKPLSEGQRKAIEHDLRDYHKRTYPNQCDLSIKCAKNRSTSQNSYAITHTEEFSRWFHARNAGHTAHLDDLKRELPLAVFQKILNALTHSLKMKPIDALRDSSIPNGIDGIKPHFDLEEFWQKNRAQCLLEYGVFTNNLELIAVALQRNAKIHYTSSNMVRCALEHRDANALHLLYSKTTEPEALLNQILEELKNRDVSFWELVIQALKTSNGQKPDFQKQLNQKLCKALKENKSQEAMLYLSAGADPNFEIPENNCKVFWQAFENKLDQVVDFMLGLELSEHTRQQSILLLMNRKTEQSIELLKKLLAKGPIDLNIIRFTQSNYFALHAAIVNNWSVETIQLLIDHGANAGNKENAKSESALELALKFNRLDLIQIFLAPAKENRTHLPNAQVELVMTNLLAKGRFDLAVSFLENHAGKISQAIKDQLLLKSIQAKNQADALKCLRAGASPNHFESPEKDCKALWLAIDNQLPQVIDFMLGLELSEHTRQQNILLLMNRKTEQSIELLKKLLAKGPIDLNIIRFTQNNYFALHAAIVNNWSVETIQLLIDHGANAGHKENAKSESALELALKFNRLDLIQIFLAPAKENRTHLPNAQVELVMTNLLAKGRFDLAVSFLENHADKISQAIKDQLLLKSIQAKNQADALKCLRAGASPNHFESLEKDCKALWLAIDNQLPQVIDFMLGLELSEHTRQQSILLLMNRKTEQSIELLKKLLTKGPIDLNIIRFTQNNYFALHAAIVNNWSVETIQLLIDHGAHAGHKENAKSESALELALKFNRLDLIQIFLAPAKGNRTHLPNEQVELVMTNLLAKDRFDLAVSFLENHAGKISQVIKDQLLLKSIQAKNQADALKCLRAGASPNHFESPQKECKALWLAIDNQLPQVIDFMLGLELTEHTRQQSILFLINSIKTNHPMDLLRQLIEKKPLIKLNGICFTSSGNSFLHSAIINGWPKPAIELLCFHGADLYHPNAEKKIPKDLTWENKREDLDEVLIPLAPSWLEVKSETKLKSPVLVNDLWNQSTAFATYKKMLSQRIVGDDCLLHALEILNRKIREVFPKGSNAFDPQHALVTAFKAITALYQDSYYTASIQDKKNIDDLVSYTFNVPNAAGMQVSAAQASTIQQQMSTKKSLHPVLQAIRGLLMLVLLSGAAVRMLFTRNGCASGFFPGTGISGYGFFNRMFPSQRDLSKTQPIVHALNLLKVN